MGKFFIQFETEDRNIADMLTTLRGVGTVHLVLGTLYCLVTESKHNSLSLRDTLLESSEDSRVFIMEIPEGVNAAWHLSIENSNWLKSIL